MNSPLEKPIRDIFKWLSIPKILSVTGSIEHLIQRVEEREIDLTTLLTAFKIIIQKNLCIDLFETKLAGNSKNFKVVVNGLKMYYSVYIYDKGYKVVFRTAIYT